MSWQLSWHNYNVYVTLTLFGASCFTNICQRWVLQPPSEGSISHSSSYHCLIYWYHSSSKPRFAGILAKVTKRKGSDDKILKPGYTMSFCAYWCAKLNIFYIFTYFCCLWEKLIGTISIQYNRSTKKFIHQTWRPMGTANTTKLVLNMPRKLSHEAWPCMTESEANAVSRHSRTPENVHGIQKHRLEN